MLLVLRHFVENSEGIPLQIAHYLLEIELFA